MCVCVCVCVCVFPTADQGSNQFMKPLTHWSISVTPRLSWTRRRCSEISNRSAEKWLVWEMFEIQHISADFRPICLWQLYGCWLSCLNLNPKPWLFSFHIHLSTAIVLGCNHYKILHFEGGQRYRSAICWAGQEVCGHWLQAFIMAPCKSWG